jgi:hypothetical protein
MSSTTVAPAAVPWGRSSAAAPVSLADVEREQQAFADVQLAERLQHVETEQHVASLGVEATATASGSDIPDMDGDLAFALKLQAIENTNAGVPTAVPSSEDDTTQDEALAAALQAQFDQEHDERISQMERQANGFTSSKVSLSMDRHRSPYPSQPPRAGAEMRYVCTLSCSSCTSAEQVVVCVGCVCAQP